MFDLQGHWGSFPEQVHTSKGWLILTRNSAAFTKIYLLYAGIQHDLGLRFGLGGSLGAFEMFRHCPSRCLAMQTPLARAAALIHSALWQRPPGRVRIWTCSSSSPPLWLSESSLAGTQAAVVLQSLGSCAHHFFPRQGEMWSRCSSQTIACVLQ